jgi:N-acetylglutamate synthase-like GNAT family acetyltransferase
MTIAFSIREAAAHDAAAVQAVLTRNAQSTHAVLAPGTRYWLAEDAYGWVLGVIGIESGAEVVLLRSAAVLSEFRGRGIGTALVQHALDAAAQSGQRAAYLFSTGAGAYWTRLGFRQVPVSEVVAALPNAPQVQQYEALGWLPTEVAWRRETWPTRYPRKSSASGPTR